MASSSPSEFTAYHMKCINFFRWTSLARTVIREDANSGEYKVKPSPILAQLVFYVYFVNTMAKLIFLAFLITGHLGPTEFLDTICGLDYFLCGVMVYISYIIWQRYPLYEIIYRLWETQNTIYRRLGCPREIKWEAEGRHSITLWAHAILAGIGCFSCTLQFYEAPKYCVYTYSLIEMDNTLLRLIFAFHEILFLSHAWSAMSCSNGLCSFEAVNMSLIIKQMSKALDELRKDVTVFHREADYSQVERDESMTKYRYSNSATEDQEDRRPLPENTGASKRKPRFNKKSEGQPNKISSGVSKSYDFKRMLYDYQKLMLISEQFNAWIGYKIVALSICAFCQYISSTTMAFQVIKLPGTGIGDIWFYIQDCTVAVYVTFRVFDFMSIVLPASQDFMDSVRRYMAAKGVVGGHTRKFQRTLRPVSLKLGPNPLRREAVLETMEMLASYYVCVALW